MRAGWLLFPMFGSVLALGFRGSETDWGSFAAPGRERVAREALALPDGSAVRLIGVPDGSGGVLFWLGERELSRVEARALGLEAAGRGVAAGLSFAEAELVCRRLSEVTGRRVRLPTRAEWMLAAAGGLETAEVAWGFGVESVPRGVFFGESRAPRRAGRAFGFGFRDLAGGVWEWMADGSAAGSAWPERNVETLRLGFYAMFPEGYRGEDAGVRVLVEDGIERRGSWRD